MWPFNLFAGKTTQSTDARDGAPSPFRGADRVAHLTEKDAFGNPKRWTVYGVCSNNVSLAVVHWQGWEDAGWRLVPVKDLAPFRYPHMWKLRFKYVSGSTVHDTGEDTPGQPCTVLYYRVNRDEGNRLMACVRFDDGTRRLVDTEHLYAVEDPQFY